MYWTIFQMRYWIDSVGPNVAAILPCGVITFFWARARERVLHEKLDVLVHAHEGHALALGRLEKDVADLHERHDDLADKIDDQR